MNSPLITIFTVPKPFTNPHVAIIQDNALLSWANLKPEVEVLIIGLETGIDQAAIRHGMRQLRHVKRNEMGTPLISSMFDLARKFSTSPFLAIINTDILLTPDILQAVHIVSTRFEKFVIAGQRWDLEVSKKLVYSPYFYQRIKERTRKEGRLHRPMGSDYFIFPRNCYTDVPDFAIGRASWDNWMIFKSRWEGWPLVDVSKDVMIIHQSHDYSHLINGQPHYHLPESEKNIHLAGGKQTIFTLPDATHELKKGHILPRKITLRKFVREVEIFPLITLHSYWLGRISYWFFHPLKAYQAIRKWMRVKGH